MSGDHLYGTQPIKFYSEAITATKKIALAHVEKKMFPECNSIIHLHRKHQTKKAPKTAWKVPDAA